MLKGDITVVLHKTTFKVNTGDSFYIPPKNYYNLVNNTSVDTELCLIQFQYDGPLPGVTGPPTSTSEKSGANKEADNKTQGDTNSATSATSNHA